MKILTTAQDNAARAAHVPIVILLELGFASGTVRFCNAGYNMVIAGQTWTGVGGISEIGEIEETTDLQANGLRVSVSGIPSSMIAIALNEYAQGRPATFYTCLLDDNFQAIGSPIVEWQGRIDTLVPIDPAKPGDPAQIAITLENREADFARARVRRFNHEDQISEYPDDLGLQFGEQMTEKEIVWPGKEYRRQ